MPKKTIIIFSTAYHPFIGGAEVAVKEITDRISEYDFILFTAKIKRGLPKKEKIGNVLVYRLGLGYSFDKFILPILAFIKYFSVVKKLKAKSYKLIIWGMMASYGSIAAYFIKLFRPNVSFLLTLQEGDSEEHLKYGKFGLVGFFGKKIIKKADLIQVISSYLKDFAIKQGAKARIFVAPNGVDLKKIKISARGGSAFGGKNEKFHPAYRTGRPACPVGRSVEGHPKGEKLKQKLDIKENEKIIITTSRLVYKNGIDILIKAIAELKKENSELKVKLLTLGDGFLRKELEKLTAELGLKEEVLFLGSVPQDKIYDYLAISDVFVRPSRSEGLGNSFLEAMAMEVPIIGTAVGGIPDFLVDNETGVFCEVDNPESLARKITLLLQDENLRGKIVENARNLVESKYDWQNISKQMEDLFNKLS